MRGLWLVAVVMLVPACKDEPAVPQAVTAVPAVPKAQPEATPPAIAPQTAQLEATPPAVLSQAWKLAARFEALWSDAGRLQSELDSLRAENPEWDLMHRTFLVLALANLALADPAYRPRALTFMDRVIEDTLGSDLENGPYHFLMAYARATPWVVKPARSLFVDGEIALMLAARRLIEERRVYRTAHLLRVEIIVQRMAGNDLRTAESYPDEAWLFCNAVALAAIRLADRLDGTDHSQLAKDWVAAAQAHLVDPATGMLISAYTLKGEPASTGRGPEGSSIWMAAHMLQVVDPVLARRQYDAARRDLGRVFLGMGYSREWPQGTGGEPDIDSGGIATLFEAGTSASGLALMASRAFDDGTYHTALLRSLALAASPVEAGGQLRYEASNLVGDAVILYGMTNGPLWELALGQVDSNSSLSPRD